jgi:predicted dienelactone hydrolase
MTSRPIAAVMALAVVALALFLLAMWSVNQLPTEFPAPTGPFSVGRAIYTWMDRNRQNQLPATPETDPELVAWIWYPSRTHSSATADYLPPRWRDAFDRSGGFVMSELLTRNLARVRVHSVEDAPLAPDERQYPVVLLLPGSSALAAGYTALAEDIASHGYVVVGLNVAYLTTVVVLPHDRVVYRSPKYDLDSAPNAEQVPLAERLVDIWSHDVGFAIDNLAILNATDSKSQFAGRLDMQSLGIVGHSLGGAVAVNFCHQDSRCKAGIDLDGRLFGPLAFERLDHPFMFVFKTVGSRADPETAHILAQVHSMYARLPASSRFGLSISGANHFTFSDQLLIKNPMLIKLLSSAGIIKLGGRRGLRITGDFITAYFDENLKGKSRGEMDALSGKHPEVSVWR